MHLKTVIYQDKGDKDGVKSDKNVGRLLFCRTNM